MVLVGSTITYRNGHRRMNARRHPATRERHPRPGGRCAHQFRNRKCLQPTVISAGRSSDPTSSLVHSLLHDLLQRLDVPSQSLQERLAKSRDSRARFVERTGSTASSRMPKRDSMLRLPSRVSSHLSIAPNASRKAATSFAIHPARGGDSAGSSAGLPPISSPIEREGELTETKRGSKLRTRSDSARATREFHAPTSAGRASTWST